MNPKKINQSEQEESQEIRGIDGDTIILTTPDDYKSRTTGLYGTVDEDKCRDLISSLYYLKETGVIETIENATSENPTRTTTYDPIEFIISTEGGSVQDMFSVYDVVRDIRQNFEIGMFGMGKVMSAGVLLLASGTKGKRKVGRNCRLMLHAISGGQFGSLKELEVDIKEVKWYKARYIACLAEETGMSERKIRSLFRKKTDTFFDAQQAVEWGIADEII